MFNNDDYIHVEDLIGICPQRFDPNKEPEAGLLFCEPKYVHILFQRYTRREYTLVSCASDATLVLQTEAPVNSDCLWYYQLLEEVAKLAPGEKYHYLQLPPRCDLDKCSYQDQYSIKYASYTQSTFNDIPANIKKWYLSNCMTVEDIDRLVCLPFGIPKQASDYYYNTKKRTDKLLYVNFQGFSNIQRESLRQHYKQNNYAHVTYVDEAIPFEQYKRDLAEHMFVLSPPGNGIDCFRTWEAIYSGAIPVVQFNKWCVYMRHLPILPMSHLYNISREHLQFSWDKMIKLQWSYDMAKLGYWKDRIMQGI